MTQPTPHQRLTRAGMSAAFADVVLDQHAHQLAEQIRAWAHEDGGAPEYGSIENVLEAADRIDPKAKR